MDSELLNPVQLSHGSLKLVLFICARYPVTGPPSALRAGGLQVTLMELQPPEKTECNIGGYGTSVKQNINLENYLIKRNVFSSHLETFFLTGCFYQIESHLENLAERDGSHSC